jgi:hypothetical protein
LDGKSKKSLNILLLHRRNGGKIWLLLFFIVD